MYNLIRKNRIVKVLKASSDSKQKKEKNMTVLFVCIVLLAVLLLVYGFFHRCPKCKKWYAVEYRESGLLRRTTRFSPLYIKWRRCRYCKTSQTRRMASENGHGLWIDDLHDYYGDKPSSWSA